MDMKKLTASDVFFNMYDYRDDGNFLLDDAKEFLGNFPYFQDCFTPEELAEDYRNRV